ncbi:alpha/beta hydrolase [Actinoplanes sp. NPDC051470]|uniref:alpha/beta fold hydrolase n=1 Tax=Actinoplanes sp. NPDC051470 TaxID=3157224 RepID=UPI0034269D94
MTVTSADGTLLAVRRRGRGPAVVLVHGSAGGLDSWDPVVPHLDEDYELWVYARRGYQPSDPGRRSKTYADDVSDLEAVIAATGGTAHVVGGSYGAVVTLHAALRLETMNKIALFEPPLFTSGTDALKPYRDLLDAGDVPGAIRLFAERVARVPAEILAAFDGQGDPAEAAGSLHDLEAMAADRPDLGRWADVSLPTLIIQGGETWAPMPATMDALAEAMPKATRVVLPGQSHFATHTAPQQFAAEVRRFLA